MPEKLFPSIIGFLFVLISCLAGPAWSKDSPGNKLIHEESPYLLKHATNPVDWHPWGEDAFTKARETNKPIFLSIGYLTCHWCNVMEEESFSDPEVAALLNDTFIPVKVDREEHPEVDQRYMEACRLLSPACGWPLTVFLTPDGDPFYAGTYIPKQNRFERIGLLELIPRAKKLWAEEHASVLQSAAAVKAALASSAMLLPGTEMKHAQLDNAFQDFSRDFDWKHGGFGRGSKFPKSLNLLFLLRYWHGTGNDRARAMVEKTLTAMRHGSIYDHLGYGFHRYATDPMWRLPHFEKMLYDQALLVLAYIEAYQATAKTAYADTAREVLQYVLSTLTGDGGAFYSAESADSQGEEGLYYLWSLNEINTTLDARKAAAAKNIFQLAAEGNFIDPLTGGKTGKNVLFTDPAVGRDGSYDEIRKELLQNRRLRPRPELDDKVLTDWNGLMIAALAKTAQVLNQPEYGEAAKKAARFILRNLRSGNGRLLHRWRNGRAGIAATAADYTFLVWGLLELYGWDFDTAWLDEALRLTDELVSGYWDEKLGGFYLTPLMGEGLLPRIKESFDTALPSSNSVAMHNLLRLSRLTGRHEFAERAAGIMPLLSTGAEQSPLAFPMFLAAVDLALAPSQEVVVVGREDAADSELMIQALRRGYFPNMVVLFKPAGGEQSPGIIRYAGFTEYMQTINNRATAYVCTNFTCDFPTNDPARMLENLTSIANKRGPVISK